MRGKGRNGGAGGQDEMDKERDHDGGKRRAKRDEARRGWIADSLIISITYANLRGETRLDAIRSNYFTLAKWLLLVAEPRGTAFIHGPSSIEGKRDEGMG